ncbi:unnamed protein product, partial [Pocillopora meandrina]
MADSHVFRSSHVIALLLLGIILSAGRLSFEDGGDIAENPGPTLNKQSCPKCSRTIAQNHRTLTCNTCDLRYHIKCGNVTPKDFKLIQRTAAMIWKCPVCLQDISLDFNELPFASLSEESFNSTVRTDSPYNESSQTDSNSDQLLEIAREINISPKD